MYEWREPSFFGQWDGVGGGERPHPLCGGPAPHSCKKERSGFVYRRLTVVQMARRVLRYVPELRFDFLVAYIFAYQEYGLSELDVPLWVRFFDTLVIDGGMIEDGKIV